MNPLLNEYNNAHAFPAFDPLLEPLSSSSITINIPQQHLQDARCFGSPDAESSLSSSPSSGFAAFAGSFYALSSDPSSPATYAASFVDPGLVAATSPYSSSQGDAASPRVGADDILGDSSLGGRDYPVICLFAGCDAKPFKRRADLDRHYKHKHADDSAKESWYCDYPRCARRQDPFHRRDHFRDHLREFHKEDIEKRGGSINEDWLGDRNTSDAWWRCAKCLVRCYVERSGYDCPGCKHSCLPKRKALRQKD